jgi:hypothetical protein
MTTTEDRAALLAQYREEAAKQYHCATTDMPAVLAAARRFSLTLYQEELVQGRHPDVSLLKWIMEQEALHAPPPPPPEGIKIELCETLVGICERCGHVHQTGKPIHDPDPPPL